MDVIALYILKVNAILAVFYFTYWLNFRNHHQFQTNRFVLMGIIVVSILLPFFPHNQFLDEKAGLKIVQPINESLGGIMSTDKPIITAGNSTVIKDGNKPQTSNPSSNPWSFSIWQIIVALYLLVSLSLLLRFVWQLSKLYFLLRRQNKSREGGINYYFVNQDISPFSFFNHLVIYKSSLNREQLHQVITHEKVHIHQWHTLDILLAELIQIIFWFNPIVYHLSKQVKLNLEFLADHQVLSNGFDVKTYQYNILQSCINKHEYRLTNLFNSSKLKLRIKMMNLQKNKKKNHLRYVYLCLVMLGSYFIINPITAQVTESNAGKGSNASASSSSSSSSSVSVTSSGTNQRKAVRVDDNKNIYIVIDQDTEIKTLDKISEKLDELGINFRVNNKNFNDGKLTAISFNIDSPGFNANYSITNEGPLKHPVIVYYETRSSIRSGVTQEVPEEISLRGKKIVDHNLKGLLVLYDNGEMELVGDVNTNWKKNDD